MSQPRRLHRGSHFENVSLLGEDGVEERSPSEASPEKGHGRRPHLRWIESIRFSRLLQPEMTLLLSVVFFCSGCVMMTFAMYQQTLYSTKSLSLSGASMEGPPNDLLEPGYARSVTNRFSPRSWSAPKGPKAVVKKEAFVDYAIPGNKVRLVDALNPDYPYTAIEHVDYAALEMQERRESRGEIDPASVQLFIAITTACCSETSRKRREAIRGTWKKDAHAMYDNVQVKFFVGQPLPGACSPADIRHLQDEIRNHDDIAVIRGSDVYDNLTNKTLGMLQYVLSSPSKVTHMLKTDDDVYVRVHRLLYTFKGSSMEPQMTDVYKGNMENAAGYSVYRNPESKWYFSREDFSDEVAAEIEGTKYVAGWGYLVSRDLMFHAMKKVYAWDNGLRKAPGWHKKLRMLEDVMMGVLVSDRVQAPDSDGRFKAPWQGCGAETAIVHLDLDAPALFKGLYEQEVSGLWERAGVVCTSGTFPSGDYDKWLEWRNTRMKAEDRI